MSLNETSLPVQHQNRASKLENELKRADEVEDLLGAVQKLVLPFIRSADEDAVMKETGHSLAIQGGGPRTALVEHHKPEKLIKLLDFRLPDGEGTGKDGLLALIEKILKYSVNTWNQGFLDKLYSSTDAVGVASELLLSVLNTNLHVYQVSPALTIIEKTTAKALASLFGFTGPHAGGISTQGGSASNTTALVIARNNLYPSTKISGNESHKFVLFTSAHGHYSLEKAAQMCGIGSNAVISVPVDNEGRMLPKALETAIQQSKSTGQTPFFINATAGTTVLGSYDLIPALSQIAKSYNLWLHVDASWGGPAIFSPTYSYKLNGSHLVDSLAINPHKMMNVPLTCSFLLTNDLYTFHRANTLPAGYLFHSDNDAASGQSTNSTTNPNDIYDLADLTLQCGRRGDSLKLALAWYYYGRTGFATLIDQGFSTAAHLSSLLASHPDFLLISSNPPPCLQICFYYAPSGVLKTRAEDNTSITRAMVQRLLPKGFMIDYAPGEKGAFFRVVVGTGTKIGTVYGLVKALEKVGSEVV